MEVRLQDLIKDRDAGSDECQALFSVPITASDRERVTDSDRFPNPLVQQISPCRPLYEPEIAHRIIILNKLLGE